MITQKITKSDLKKIHDVVCDSWKTILTKYVNENPWSEEIEISESDINKGYSEANDAQKKLISKYFNLPKDVKEQIQTLDDVFALNNTTQKDFDKKWKGFDGFETNLALERLIAIAYNGREATKDDIRYYTYLRKDGSCDVYYCNVFVVGIPVRLCFLNSAHVSDAFNKFPNVYKKSRF